MVQDRVIWEFVDGASGFLRSSNWLQTGIPPTTLAADAQASNNGNLLYVTSGTPTVGTQTPGSALYPLVTDLAQFNFSTGAGTRVVFVLPAPFGTMFNNDGTINPLDPNAAAIIADCLATLADSAGNPATIYLGGIKVSRRTEQNG